MEFRAVSTWYDHICVSRHMQRYFSHTCDGTYVQADRWRSCTYGRASISQGSLTCPSYTDKGPTFLYGESYIPPQLVVFYDTLGIRSTYSRLKPPASSRVIIESDTSYNNRLQAGFEASTMSITPAVEYSTDKKLVLACVFWVCTISTCDQLQELQRRQIPLIIGRYQCSQKRTEDTCSWSCQSHQCYNGCESPGWKDPVGTFCADWTPSVHSGLFKST